MKKLLAGTGAGAAVVAMLAVPAAAASASASAQAARPKCVTVHDHVSKTDSGHGTPAAWADLSLNRTTTVCGDKVTLIDKGTLWTRTGAGTPNGTGGQIENRVVGVVHGLYTLTVSGGTLAHQHGDTSLSSTEYVKSLFSPDTTVTGGAYGWAYSTRCEHWLDSSANNDGQGAAAGDITGKLCSKPSHSPTPSPSTTPTSPGGDGGSATPTTVPVGAPETGDGTGGAGGSNVTLMAAGGLVCLLGAAGGLLMWRRRLN
jgi:hypothetical protein